MSKEGLSILISMVSTVVIFILGTVLIYYVGVSFETLIVFLMGFCLVWFIIWAVIDISLE